TMSTPSWSLLTCPKASRTSRTNESEPFDVHVPAAVLPGGVFDIAESSRLPTANRADCNRATVDNGLVKVGCQDPRHMMAFSPYDCLLCEWTRHLPRSGIEAAAHVSPSGNTRMIFSAIVSTVQVSI